MQKYAPNTSSSSSNHHRSMSLCNYDELCRAKKCEIIRRKKISINDNVTDETFENDSAEFCCETCPLNSDGICEKHLNVLLKKNNDYNKNNNSQDDLEVNIWSAKNKSNQSSFNNNNNINNNDCSTIIDINNDQSLKLFFPIKFSCSFLSPDLPNCNKKQSSTLPLLKQQNQQSKTSTSMPPRQGHRRSLSLKQQFEFGYDYLLSEFEHARNLAGKTVTHATKTVSQATGAVWNVCHFSNLPKWMQDNEYLHGGHRPPLPTFWDCIKSIFRLHTETGNIWTHGLGALMFLGLFIYEFVTISAHKTAVDRLMLTIYFCGIILCLLFSCLFHTFSCYASPKVIKIFSKLDYCGISLQIIGSMTPALYYGFYEDFSMFKLYISFGVVLCILSIAVSLWDKFGEPQYRSFRAFVFLCFGLSNVIPGVHWYIILDSRLLTAYYMFILQGALYVIGSLLYANRIPERLFPGKCDYMFQSHQIFHVLVVLAALVHLNGINSMAEFRTHHRQLNAMDHSQNLN